jgi:hypothetical protein
VVEGLGVPGYSFSVLTSLEARAYTIQYGSWQGSAWDGSGPRTTTGPSGTSKPRRTHVLAETKKSQAYAISVTAFDGSLHRAKNRRSLDNVLLFVISAGS